VSQITFGTHTRRGYDRHSTRVEYNAADRPVDSMMSGDNVLPPILRDDNTDSVVVCMYADVAVDGQHQIAMGKYQVGPLLE